MRIFSKKRKSAEQRTLARPATFRGASPREAVDILLKKKIGDFSQLKSEAENFIKNASETLSEPFVLPENNQFLLISEREAIICKAKESIENAKITLNFIIPFEELAPWLTVLSKCLDDTLIRGVNIRWITEKPTNTGRLPESL